MSTYQFEPSKPRLIPALVIIAFLIGIYICGKALFETLERVPSEEEFFAKHPAEIIKAPTSK